MIMPVMHSEWVDCIMLSLRILGAFMILLLSAAYLTYVERKMIAAIQLRRGPNRVGIFGLLQPIADGLKLLHKETIFPFGAKRGLFIAAPLITFAMSFTAWSLIPIDKTRVFADISVGVLGILALSSLAVYGVALAGWASQSSYGILGAVRSVAQMISYEVSLGLVVASVLLWTGSANLTCIVEAQRTVWFVFPLFPMFVIFIISIFAETNRIPFDLPEAESELVAGYHVEYASIPFALFFLAEYANIILMSAFTVLLFLGGWLPPFECLSFIPGPVLFFSKTALMIFLFILARASLPRFRYDQLMSLGWKACLPFSLAWLILSAALLLALGWLPKGGG